MRKFVHALLLLTCGIFAAALLLAQTTAQQSNDLRVFVRPLEGSDAELAKSVGKKLIHELEKHSISVTESKDDADAILTGSGLMQTSRKHSYGSHPAVCIRGSVRLVNKNGVTLWTEDVSSSRYAVNETSSFVDRVTDGVAKALSEESKRRSSEPVAQIDRR
ncbi:MAG: hypothetical protein ABSE51_06985 [Terracidiphilus sp.]